MAGGAASVSPSAAGVTAEPVAVKSVILLVTTAPPASEPADTWPEKAAEVPLRETGKELSTDLSRAGVTTLLGMALVTSAVEVEQTDPEIVFAEMLLNVPAPDIVQYLER
jgi:hypothetical protein